jgi:hypothetical protein
MAGIKILTSLLSYSVKRNLCIFLASDHSVV